MINIIFLNFDLLIYVLVLVITGSALYSTCVNLVRKRISKVGFDALILLFFDKKRAMMIREDPRLVRRMGIVMLLVAIGGVNEVVSNFIQDIWPLIYK